MASPSLDVGHLSSLKLGDDRATPLRDREREGRDVLGYERGFAGTGPAATTVGVWGRASPCLDGVFARMLEKRSLFFG